MTYDEFRENRYFDSLTGLRAIAVGLVLITHFAGQEGAFLTGSLGVQIFFVLSGFLITTLLLREVDESGGVSLTRFYIRRVFRIFPVYYLWLALMLWQAFKMSGLDASRWQQFYDALPYYLTLNNEQFGDTAWRITWSLGVEWKFYLVWPILAFMIAKNAASRIFMAALLMLLMMMEWHSPLIGPLHYSVLLEGSVLAILMHSRRGYRFIEPLTKPIVSMAILVLFALLQTRTVQMFALLQNDAAHALNLYGLAVVVLIPAVLGSGLPNRILSSKPLVFVGERSYSLYLIQGTIAEAVSGFAVWRHFNFEFTAIVFCAGLIVADVLYRYVERPMIRVGRKVEMVINNMRPHWERPKDVASS